MLWTASDWKGLADRPSNLIGLEARYARLAGKHKEFDDTIAEIKKQAASSDEAYELRRYAIALLFNSNYKEGIELLIDKKKKEPALVFDLLCTQMRHQEAFELVDDPMAREDATLQMRRARMLYLLGERDAAIQLFQKVAAEAQKNTALVRNLIAIEMDLALRDLAIDHAASALAEFGRQEMPVDDLLKPIFGDNASFVPTWLSLFKNEDPAVALRRIHKIFAGKTERKQLVEWCDNLIKEHNLGTGQISHFEGVDAVAAAYKAIGDTAKADEYLKLAVEKEPRPRRCIDYGDFLMEQKRYKDAAQAYATATKARRRRKRLLQLFLLQSAGSADWLRRQTLTTTAPRWAPISTVEPLMLAGDAKEGRRLIELAHWLPLGDDLLRCKLARQLNRRILPELGDKEGEMLLRTGYYTHFAYGNMLDALGEQAFKKKEYSKAADYYDRIMVGIMRTNARLVEPGENLLLPEMISNFRTLDSLAAGKVDEAVNEALASLEKIPGSILFSSSMVPDLDKLGRKSEADTIYRKVYDVREKFCKDYPNSGFAHSSAAMFMANCRRDLDMALKHAKKATELEPDNANYLDSLAEVHFRKGDRETALRLMKKCIEMKADRPYFHRQLLRFKDQPIDSPTPVDVDQ